MDTLSELREKLKLFEKYRYKASAKEIRRKIRALEQSLKRKNP